jgi:hypothetical protein
VVEALGYLGGALAFVAGFITLRRLWPDIPTGVELAFAAAATVLLFGAGAAIGATGDAALGRLRSVLWALSTGCLAALVGLLAAEVWDFSPISTTLLAAMAATLCAVGLWLRSRAPLQHLVMFAGTWGRARPVTSRRRSGCSSAPS